MGKSDRIKGLADGVRALEALARHAPVDLPDFARIMSVPTELARTLIETFEQGGYVRRTPHGGLFVLTMLGSTLVAVDNPPGALVARGAGVIDSLARAGDRPVSLSVRRGQDMLFCLGSQPIIGDLRIGARVRLSACPQGLAQVAGDVCLGGEATAVPVLANRQVAGVLSFHDTADCTERQREFLFRLLADEAHRLARGVFEHAHFAPSLAHRRHPASSAWLH